MAGCAKFPSTGAGSQFQHVIFRMRVAREIRPDYVYIFAIRVSDQVNPDTNGPVPVISYPNANGFVAGQPTHYVIFDPTLSRPYVIRRFVRTSEETNPPDPTSPIDLTKWTDVGVPINETDPQAGDNTLSFEITLDQLGDSFLAAKDMRSMQVNLLTMNRISTSSGAGRVIDSLGDNRSVNEVNDFVTIPLTTSRVFDNQSFNFVEPTSDSPADTDCPDPDLDIVDWSVEVRLP